MDHRWVNADQTQVLVSGWGCQTVATALLLAGSLCCAACGQEQLPGAEDLVGDWFRCEFFDHSNPGTPPSDSCATLDDDGLRFTSAGQAYDIEAQGSQETACAEENAGACFSRDSVDVTISGDRLGEFSLAEGHVVITEKNGDRIEFDLVQGQDYAEFLNYRKIKDGAVESDARYSYMYRYR